MENQSSVSIILISKWPVSLPLPLILLWLARPRAVCHANSVSYGSGGWHRSTRRDRWHISLHFHIIAEACPSNCCREEEEWVKTQWVKAGMERVLVLILHFLSFAALYSAATFLPRFIFCLCYWSCGPSAASSLPAQESLDIDAGCVLGWDIRVSII